MGAVPPTTGGRREACDLSCRASQAPSSLQKRNAGPKGGRDLPKVTSLTRCPLSSTQIWVFILVRELL